VGGGVERDDGGSRSPYRLVPSRDDSMLHEGDSWGDFGMEGDGIDGLEGMEEGMDVADEGDGDFYSVAEVTHPSTGAEGESEEVLQ